MTAATDANRCETKITRGWEKGDAGAAKIFVETAAKDPISRSCEGGRGVIIITGKAGTKHPARATCGMPLNPQPSNPYLDLRVCIALTNSGRVSIVPSSFSLIVIEGTTYCIEVKIDMEMNPPSVDTNTNVALLPPGTRAFCPANFLK